MSGERVLIIEDDPLLQSVLAERLRHEGLEVQAASTIAEARRALDQGEPDVALCDLRLPDGESLDLIREAAPRSSAVFVVMTAHATVSSAVAALKLGARDYLEKPFSLDRAVATIRQALEMTALRREVAALRDRSSHAGTTVIAESPPMKRVFELVERLAAVDATTVLIEGESGTGKGAIAQALHRMSRRAGGPFLDVTCSALPETLMESELFGHEKGAFTEARSAKRGLVELAEGGTLFLDEIGELTPGVQAKLLRFIEEKTFRRLGGTRDLTVDVRIMTATNRDLAAEVSAGRFRADLYYRLRVIPIALPPLRERPEDLAPLARHFVAHFAREFAKRIGEITPEALTLLAAHHWPGNVRELRNVMERAVLLADGSAIGAKELPPEVARPDLVAMGASSPSQTAGAGTLEEVERRLLATALEKSHGNQSRAAAVLGISRHQMRTRMRRHGLLAVLALVALGLAAPLRAQQRTGDLACERCHGSREFLAGSAAHAIPESLVVGRATLAASAHAGLSCVQCHPRAAVFPHRADAGLAAPCGSCHAGADSTWHTGVHAAVRSEAGVTCKNCHGTHDVQPVARLATPDGRAVMDRACTRCHETMAFTPADVHRDSVGCVDCHGAHGMRPVKDASTNGVPVTIAEGCTRCHPAEARSFWADTHGTLALTQAGSPAPIGPDTSATCVDCHFGHAVRIPRDRAAHFAFADACTKCHAVYAAAFRETYHGQATRVGSERAALCADCHSPHAVYPAANPLSSVSAANRVATCRRCHTEATALFVGYRPHADPRDPARYPGLYAIWLTLTVFLVVVTLIYLAHAVLVARRLLLERRRQA